MKTAIGYVRVSSEEQADSGLGLEAQRQRIAAFCAMKGLELAQTFEDAAVSGGKPLASRPAGSRLLAEARKSKSVVVVAKLDRLFRSVADAAAVIADFDKKGIELIAIAENFDMTNPFGRAMAQMCAIFAELERSMIRERTKAAMGVKRTRRERISRHAPFGWDFGPDGSLLENVQEEEVLRSIHALRAEGKSFQAIANMLNEKGIAAKQGGTWGHTSVRAVLRRNAA
jgi:site-specific DNA recombinase